VTIQKSRLKKKNRKDATMVRERERKDEKNENKQMIRISTEPNKARLSANYDWD
jgi:hypothetical protein